MKLIEVGCLNDRVAVAGEITVPLVISHKDDDIWPFSVECKQACREKYEKYFHRS